MKSTSLKPQRPIYESPRIAHKGQLKQFAGSPLGKLPDGNPLNLPGK